MSVTVSRKVSGFRFQVSGRSSWSPGVDLSLTSVVSPCQFCRPNTDPVLPLKAWGFNPGQQFVLQYADDTTLYLPGFYFEDGVLWVKLTIQIWFIWSDHPLPVRHPSFRLSLADRRPHGPRGPGLRPVPGTEPRSEFFYGDYIGRMFKISWKS